MILDHEQQVNRLVQQESGKYDYIIIDCPPSFDSLITYSSLLVADLAIIPLLCSANDL
jgi:chromosome partitioning protein